MSRPDNDLPSASRQGARHRVLIVAAVMVLVAGAVVTGVLLATRNGGPPVVPGSTDGFSTSASPPTATSLSGSPGTVSSAGPTPTSTSGFGYPALWPFDSVAKAQAWQQADRAGGHQPWHVDAGAVALAFTQGYLGYQNVDKVVSSTGGPAERWIGVGFDNPNGQPVTSAILHLVLISSGVDAPWEVVGTRDTTLSVTSPAYDSTVRSPVLVGGRITGVDESLSVLVRESDLNEPVGAVHGVAAGGADAPWSVSVPLRTTHGHVLTIAVSAGGHLAAVERFAITGVRY